MNTKYTVDYFIKKFSNIPRNEWCKGMFKKGRKKCVLGHCGVKTWNSAVNTPNIYSQVRALRSLVVDIVLINDGVAGYHSCGKHPRTRVLKALKIAKKALND